jgi:hypothetical protein
MSFNIIDYFNLQQKCQFKFTSKTFGLYVLNQFEEDMLDFIIW